MIDSCIECGKKLKELELTEGFCSYCLAKIDNDFRILEESFEESEIQVENF
jgi:predicted amidophosphoribosyltransferase